MLIWIIVAVLAVMVVLPLLNQSEGFGPQVFKVRFIAIVSTTYLQMSQLQVMHKGMNIAKGKRVGRKDEIMPGMAQLAVDGTSAARAFPNIYQSASEQPGWILDLGKEYNLEELDIIYYNRADGCADRAAKMHMFFFDGKMNNIGPDITFTDEAKQMFQFSKPGSAKSGSSVSTNLSVSSSTNNIFIPTTSGITQSYCSYRQTKPMCLGSVDQNGKSCSWTDATNSCNSAQGPTPSSTSTSSKCSVKTSKSSCKSTLINAEDGLYCSWSDAQNKCSYLSSGTGGPAYNASSGVILPPNVSNNCAACVGNNYYWNPTTSRCSPTDTPGYQRSC